MTPECLNNKLIMQSTNQPLLLEITILSAQDLMMKASLAFPRRLRPFVTLNPTTSRSRKHVKLYKTKVDNRGGVNPTWGDKFQLFLDHTFFDQRSYPGIYLQLYTKHLLIGQSPLGWCLIPLTDIVNRFFPVGSTQFLSYRLRARDGSRGHGVVNVAVRLEGSLCVVHPSRQLISNVPHQLPGMHKNDEPAIGMPAKTQNSFS